MVLSESPAYDANMQNLCLYVGHLEKGERSKKGSETMKAMRPNNNNQNRPRKIIKEPITIRLIEM